MTQSKPTNQLDIFRYKGEPIRITLGTIVMVLLCTFLIVIATFTQISIPHFLFAPDSLFSMNEGVSKTNNAYLYIPQIPTIIFIAGLMGRIFGSVAVLVYIALGLFFYPIFAMGGGLKYIMEYNFGYILAYLPAVFFTGTILKNCFTFPNIVKATFIGVLTIHLVGIIYVLFIDVLKGDGNFTVFSNIIIQSGWKILYDLFFSYIALLLSNLTKKILWLIMC